ncbi:MAG TPA: rhomboid family intramembrane serine protease [Myxococcales bacterium]|jgi:membrane associated rhomboid family serine protease
MTSARPVQMDFGGAFSRPPPATLALMIVTGVVSVLAMVDVGFGTHGWLGRNLAFAPSQVLALKLWTPFSYLFLQTDPLSLILYEAFGLWMFAAPLERSWGQRRFLFYFFATGVGAALFVTGLALLLPSLMGAGSSGTWVAGEAVLLAWILMNWHATVYLFVIPVRAPVLLLLSLGLPVLYALMGQWQPFVTPLVAMGIGYLLLKKGISPRRGWLHLRAWWIDKQLKRRSRHLQVVPPPGNDREPKKPKYLN